MNNGSMEEIARTGSAEDVKNLLKAHGKTKWIGQDSRGSTYCIDTILYASSQDKDEARKAQKIALVAAYEAQGNKAFKNKKLTKKTPESPQLTTLRQLAFESAAEKVADLLKAQADDAEAVRAIIEGAQQDRKHLSRRETKEDKDRRADKKNVLTEYLAKTGRFASAKETPPDAPKQNADKPVVLKL
jgi:hypothetical protein